MKTSVDNTGKVWEVKEDYKDYTPGDCVGVWDHAIEQGLCVDILSPLWPDIPGIQNGENLDEHGTVKKMWSFDNKGAAGSSIISFGSDMWNYSENYNGLNPKTHRDKLEEEWPGVLKRYPFMKEIESSLRERIPHKDLVITRTWFNGHTYGLGDQIHRDIDPKDWKYGEAITVLFYVNHRWGNGWDGETYILDDSYDVMRAITPRPGRMIAFDSRMWHKGTAPARLVFDLRVTLAVHTRVLPK